MITSIELLQNSPQKEIGLYIHIPFCRRKCEYCDFISFPIQANVPDEYVSALINELGTARYNKLIKSLYFGGGTPSLLTVKQIDKIINHVNKLFDLDNPEISIEINPDDIDESWIKDIKKIGVNRVSIGVQSFSDEELNYLGRRHDAQKAIHACKMVSSNFDNWSLDLIFGIPFQDIKKWEKNLQTALKFNPPHISTYNLTFEEGTPLYTYKIKDKPDDDLCLNLYKYTEICLKENEYEHYEISNFAREGYQCKHNLIYWHNEYYLGIGVSAFSFLNSLRCANFTSLEKYLKSPGEKEEVDYLTESEIKVETLIQYFRLSEGISDELYFKRFSTHLIDDFGGALKNLINKGLIEYNQGKYKPTPQGFYLNNQIGRELLNYK